MDVLLDTHVIIWWDMGGGALSSGARDLIAAPENAIFVSAASILEIAIKRRSGKLVFEGRPSGIIDLNGFVELPISAADAEAAGGLDWTHADPFDRLLVAQAQRRGLTLLTADAVVLGHAGPAMIRAR